MIVFNWYKPFWVDRVGNSDDFRSEKPHISDTAKNVQDAISVDKQRSVHDIADLTGLSVAIFGVDLCQNEYNEWVENGWREI